MLRSFFLLCLMIQMGVLPAQTPRGRILEAIDLGAVSSRIFLETETMIVRVTTRPYVDQGRTREEWHKAMFWDKDGSNYSERMFPSGCRVSGVSIRAFARGNEVFVPADSSYYKVSRNPEVPINRFADYQGDAVCDITDDHYIVRIPTAQDDDGILFYSRRDGVRGGRVATSLRVQNLVVRKDDIVFTSRDSKRGYRFHRMAHPDFSSKDVVRMKIATFPGNYQSLPYFGKDFAIGDKNGKRSIIRYSDPAKKGKAGIYPDKSDEPYGNWFECNETLACWSSGPIARLAYVEFASKSCSLKPIGLPAGLLGSRYWDSADNHIYVSNPSQFGGRGSRSKWIYRLDFTPGRSLTLDNPVADERDGTLRFTARLDQAADQAVVFDYETADGSALSGVDFTPVSGRATIPAGQTEFFIDVPLVEDFTIERPESLELRLTAVQGAFCDSLAVVGRIRGSGARLLEEVSDDVGGFVVGTFDPTTSREDPVRSFAIGAHQVDCRKLGFDGFWPVADTGDGYRYARAVAFGSDKLKLCQFDGATGDLLEVFDHAPFNCQGGELLLGNGIGYARYGFFDGFPVVSLEGISPVENGGEQLYTMRSERTNRDLGFAAHWSHPSRAAGDISFERMPTGDLAFRIIPSNDGQSDFGQSRGINVTITEAGGSASSAMISKVSITDDDELRVSLLAAGSFPTMSLVASGNRLWVTRGEGSKLEAFDFLGGTLKPGPKIALPKGLAAAKPGYGGQGLALDGSRLLVNAHRLYVPVLLAFANSDGRKPKGAFSLIPTYPTSLLATPDYNIVSASQLPPNPSNRVEVRDLKNQMMASLAPVDANWQSFGYAMAVAGDILWIASPRADELGGRVDGYRLGSFAHVATLTSPEPVKGGGFGYSIAAHGAHLVIGEPSNVVPGAVWVFSADGATLLKRLSSGAVGEFDGFGCQVAVRKGRVLVGAGTLDHRLNSDSVSRLGRRWALLWPDLDGGPLRLLSTGDEPEYEREFSVALLDDCAVMAATSYKEGIIEYAAIPATSTGLAFPLAARSAVVDVAPVWPEEGSLAPVWSIVKTESGRAEVTVDLGGVPSDPGQLLVEWSPDLVHWEVVADASGGRLLASKVLSFTASPDRLKFVTLPSDSSKSFFRLRSGN